MHNPNSNKHRNHSTPTITYKRQWNTDNWKNAKVHTDINKHVSKNKPHEAKNEINAKIILYAPNRRQTAIEKNTKEANNN